MQIAFATYGDITKFEPNPDGSGYYDLEYSDDRSAVKAFEEIEKAEVCVSTCALDYGVLILPLLPSHTDRGTARSVGRPGLPGVLGPAL